MVLDTFRGTENGWIILKLVIITYLTAILSVWKSLCIFQLKKTRDDHLNGVISSTTV